MDETPKDPTPPEGNTEPVLLPAPPAPPAPRDEAAETGTVDRAEIDDMVKAKAKRAPVPPAPPPAPPKAPPPTDTKQPPPLWFWVTFGVLVVAITVGLTYVLKARGGSGAAPGEGRGGESEVRGRDPAGPRIA